MRTTFDNSKYGKKLLSLAAIAAAIIPASVEAYSTKLHMVTGDHIARMLGENNTACRIRVGGWNRVSGGVDLRATLPGGDAEQVDRTHTIDLSGEICSLITSADTRQYFVSGTTGPDTFPGMFGNTDPTHALTWNTAWQIPVLWQNARSRQEKAFVLGWVVHFAGDLNAHGLANLHAEGVWMADTGRTPQLRSPLGRALNALVPKTVWGHILTETYYAAQMLPYPERFNNELVWPEEYVKKMFFNPESPLYKHYDYVFLRFAGFDDAHTGKVAKAFMAIYRAVFLLYDYSAKQQNIWDGRKRFFAPRRNNTILDYLKWMFAEQAFNFFRRKTTEARETIDGWYLATHRAQQAIVTASGARFDGSRRYPRERQIGDRTVTAEYHSGGIQGLLDAYSLWLAKVTKLFTHAFSTDDINPESHPQLRQYIDRVRSTLGQYGAPILQGLINLKEGFAGILKGAFNGVLRALELFFPNLRDWARAFIYDETICREMSDMCQAIDAQRTAFGIRPGDIDTYLRWPIYRNTITAGALMLEQMKSLSRSSGDETASPAFGLPSGDFGCTAGCTSIFSRNPDLFMPSAGAYYCNDAIAAAMPDYCMHKTGATNDTRRRADELRASCGNAALNGPYVGISNALANATARGSNAAAFTCLMSARPSGNRCRDNGTYSRTARLEPYPEEQEARTFSEKLKKYWPVVYRLISGRWDYTVHQIPDSDSRIIVPQDAVSVSGGAPVSYLEGETVNSRGPSADLCYGALRWTERGQEATVAGAMGDPAAYHRALNVEQDYEIIPGAGQLVDSFRNFVSQTFSNVSNWISQRAAQLRTAACRTVQTWVVEPLQNLLNDVRFAACRTRCWASTWEMRPCSRWGVTINNCVPNHNDQRYHECLGGCDGARRQVSVMQCN